MTKTFISWCTHFSYRIIILRCFGCAQVLSISMLQEIRRVNDQQKINFIAQLIFNILKFAHTKEQVHKNASKNSIIWLTDHTTPKFILKSKSLCGINFIFTIVFTILTLREFPKLIGQEHNKLNFKPFYQFFWVIFGLFPKNEQPEKNVPTQPK